MKYFIIGVLLGNKDEPSVENRKITAYQFNSDLLKRSE